MGNFNSDDHYTGFSDSSLENSPPAMQETMVRFLGREDPLERDRLPTPVFLGFPCGSAGKESACNMGDLGSIPGSGRSFGEGNGNPLQYSCLENPMDREAWQAAVHGVARIGHDLVINSPPRYYYFEIHTP